METPPRPAWASAYGSHTRPVPEGRLKEHLVSKCIVLMTLLRTVCPPSGCSRRLGGLAITVPGWKIFASRTDQRSVLPCVRPADLSPTPSQCRGLTEVQPPNCQARFHSAEVRSDVQPVSGKSEAPSVCWGLQGGGSVHVEWNARGLLQAGSEVSADRLHEVG